MPEINQYVVIVTEIIDRISVVYGQDIAILKAYNVSELVINDQGKITNIKGEPVAAIQKLINEYVELSGVIVKNILKPILDKYPGVIKS